MHTVNAILDVTKVRNFADDILDAQTNVKQSENYGVPVDHLRVLLAMVRVIHTMHTHSKQSSLSMVCNAHNFKHQSRQRYQYGSVHVLIQHSSIAWSVLAVRLQKPCVLASTMHPIRIRTNVSAQILQTFAQRNHTLERPCLDIV